MKGNWRPQVVFFPPQLEATLSLSALSVCFPHLHYDIKSAINTVCNIFLYIDVKSFESSPVALGLFLEGAVLLYLRRGWPAVCLSEVVWRRTHVSRSSLQLLEWTDSHYSCQLLFSLSAPIVRMHRTAAAAAVTLHWALRTQITTSLPLRQTLLELLQ